MKKGKKILFALLAVLLLALLSFWIWAEQTYGGSDTLEDLLTVEPTEEDGVYYFTPETSREEGVILYPGAKVEPEAYFYIGQELVKNGYVVAIPSMPLNLAIIGANKADDIIEQRSNVEKWFIGGHSLGGVAAASYAYEHQSELGGLFFLASFPTDSNDFSTTTFPILSLYGERDGLTTPDKVAEASKLLPSTAILQEIKGGNHAQFGLYGKQSGDNDATISPREQQDSIITSLLKWMDESK